MLNSKFEPDYIKAVPNAPGLVGKMAHYIDEVSFKEQPLLSMAAAIVGTGAIYGHRLQTETDLRTNVCVFALAESGAGKEGGRRALQMLFDKMPDGFKEVVCGEPASAPGLLSALSRNGGVGLFLIDEVGHYLSGLTNRNSQATTCAIMPLLTKLFSQANRTYRGTEYSDRAKGLEQRKDINQPCACVLGSSVPERVYSAITLDDVSDGFLPRWLIIESTNNTPRTNLNIKSFADSTGPELIEEILRRAKIIDANTQKPISVPMTADARHVFNGFVAWCNQMREKSINEGSSMKYIYTRACEHVEKLALIGCEYKDDKPVITVHSIQWAIAVVQLSMLRMEQAIRCVSASPHEQKLDKMLQIIQHTGKMKRTKFCNVCRKWSAKERNMLLIDLKEAGLVREYKESNTTYIEPIQDDESIENVKM